MSTSYAPIPSHRMARPLQVFGLGLLVGLIPYAPMLIMLLLSLYTLNAGFPLIVTFVLMEIYVFFTWTLPYFLAGEIALSLLGFSSPRWRLLGVGIFTMWGLLVLLLVLRVIPIPGVSPA